MKVLFVCRANRPRSQMAMAFYHQLHPGKAASACTIVDVPGKRLGELTPKSKTPLLMREVGIDVSKNERTQLTQAMLTNYDKIIVVAEPENTSVWLLTNPEAEIWDVDDPMGRAMPERRLIRDEIKARAAELDRRLHEKCS